ncbi:transposase [Halogeometricum pallidum JCM 14848]|uniref:Transposase n=1 Tax=Halogeometricum pallidum JCM 14848 TaxID=1227487 RepID=M0CZT0_HALPD|nr:transposase [Halogeometricum pallidum JCM 14848]
MVNSLLERPSTSRSASSHNGFIRLRAPFAELFKRHGTDPAAAFLHGVVEKHDCEDTVFLVDQFGYRTALSRLGLSGWVDYTNRNLIKEWFHTLKMRVDRFHNSWVGSRLSVCQWIALFIHYYNDQRPHQALNGRRPVEEVN